MVVHGLMGGPAHLRHHSMTKIRDHLDVSLSFSPLTLHVGSCIQALLIMAAVLMVAWLPRLSRMAPTSGTLIDLAKVNTTNLAGR